MTGWDLWAGGPPNHLKDGIQPLVGVIETYWLPFPFTMNWRFTRPGMISFKKGEPFCFVLPMPHESFDAVQPIMKSISDDPELERQYKAWGESRNNFLNKLDRSRFRRGEARLAARLFPRPHAGRAFGPG